MKSFLELVVAGADPVPPAGRSARGRRSRSDAARGSDASGTGHERPIAALHRHDDGAATGYVTSRAKPIGSRQSAAAEGQNQYAACATLNLPRPEGPTTATSRDPDGFKPKHPPERSRPENPASVAECRDPLSDHRQRQRDAESGG